MGTRYIRDEELPAEIVINYDETTFRLDIPHIYSELTIGNEIKIQVRQASALSFIELNRFETLTRLEINVEDVEAGQYDLLLESFDALGGVYSALKTDYISIIKLEDAIPPSFEDELENWVIESIDEASWSLPDVV